MTLWIIVGAFIVAIPILILWIAFELIARNDRRYAEDWKRRMMR
jgi:hypothetical protein